MSSFLFFHFILFLSIRASIHSHVARISSKICSRFMLTAHAFPLKLSALEVVGSLCVDTHPHHTAHAPTPQLFSHALFCFCRCCPVLAPTL